MYMILRGRQTAAADDDWCKLLADRRCCSERALRQGEQKADVT